MKNKIAFLSTLILAVILLIGFDSCKKDNGPTALTLKTLVAGTVDMNGAVAPNTVPANPTIVATFSTNVDAATATTGITLLRNYDKATVPVTVTVSGATVTIVPTTPLASGALFNLKMAGSIKSTDGELLTAVDRAFTTIGTFAPSGQVAWWNFEGDAKDKIGTYNSSAEIAITYTASHSAAAGKAATFNGTTSIIEIPNGDKLMNTQDFTLSFWVKPVNSGKGHFVIGLAAFYGFQFEINADFTNFKMPVQFDYGDGTSGTGGDLLYNQRQWWMERNNI